MFFSFYRYLKNISDEIELAEDRPSKTINYKFEILQVLKMLNIFKLALNETRVKRL